MRIVFKNDDIAHVWASGDQSIGRSSSMSFNDECFNSYGTTIARRVNATPKHRRYYVIDVATFSVTTSRHQSRVRNAIPEGEKVFLVRCGKRGQCLDFARHPEALIQHYIDVAKPDEAKLGHRLKRICGAELSRQAFALGEARSVAQWFNHKKLERKITRMLDKKKAEVENFEKIHTKFRAQQKKVEERLAKQERLNAAHAASFLLDPESNHWLVDSPNSDERFFGKDYKLLSQELRDKVLHFRKHQTEIQINAWLAGNRASLPNNVPTMLRVEGSEVVTSRGARVPRTEARLAFKFAMSKRSTGWHRNGEQFKVGMYHLDAVNENGLVAGCHRISWQELERFGKLQGWM